jgi:hypothetical protein
MTGPEPEGTYPSVKTFVENIDKASQHITTSGVADLTLIPTPVPNESELIGQINKLDLYSSKNHPNLITPSNFPHIPEGRLAVERFWATNNLIQMVLKARSTTSDDEVQRKLGAEATKLIKQRDQEIKESLPEGDVDEELIKDNQFFYQSGESNFLLDYVKRYGESDLINQRHFPALRAAPDSLTEALKDEAIKNKKAVEPKSRFGRS